MSSISHTERLPPLMVAFESDRCLVAPGESCTFGRAGDIEIDSANRLLHRVLGRFFDRDGQWWLANEGRSAALVLTDVASASYAHVVAGSSTPLPFREAHVSFTVGRANYRLAVTNEAIEPDDRRDAPSGLPMADATLTTGVLVFNDEQFELLVALAQPRLDGPITASDLPTNRELARRLGWSASKFGRKLDNLCEKLDRAGVTGLRGSVAEVATDRRVVLANFVVEQGIVGDQDRPC